MMRKASRWPRWTSAAFSAKPASNICPKPPSAITCWCTSASPSAAWMKKRLRALTRSSRSEEHTSELQSLRHLVCRLLLEKNKKQHGDFTHTTQTERRVCFLLTSCPDQRSARSGRGASQVRSGPAVPIAVVVFFLKAGGPPGTYPLSPPPALRA